MLPKRPGKHPIVEPPPPTIIDDPGYDPHINEKPQKFNIPT